MVREHHAPAHAPQFGASGDRGWGHDLRSTHLVGFCRAKVVALANGTLGLLEEIDWNVENAA